MLLDSAMTVEFEVTKFKPLLRRARTSRNSTLMELKNELKDYLPSKDADSLLQYMHIIPECGANALSLDSI